MNKEVEILKIGSILPAMPIKDTRVYDTSQFRNKQTIMVVNNAGPIFEYYISTLRENCNDKYSFQKADQSIVGYPNVFRSSLVGSQPNNKLKGISDGDPLIGKPYTINNSTWHTSTVEKIIDDCVLITKNSVYAIHNISDVREKKLGDLGL